MHMRLPSATLAGIKPWLRDFAWVIAPERMRRRVRYFSPGLIEQLDQHQLIFIHIPKTGGVSVGSVLYGDSLGHRSWREWKHVDPQRFAKFLKFAVVRDPIDRFLSAFDYFMAGGRKEEDVPIAEQFVRPSGSIGAFIEQLSDSYFLNELTDKAPHFRQQVTFVTTLSRRIMVNQLIPFEYLNEDASRLLKTTALPHNNVTQGTRTPPSALSGREIEILNNIYRLDTTLHRFALKARNKNVFGVKLS